MSTDPPQKIGRYEIIREIARSNDIVYEAYDPKMNRRIALKVLHMPSGLDDATISAKLGRFKREAKAAGSVDHPSIVTVFDVDEDGGKHFIVMEYLDGVTLRSKLDSAGKLDPDKAEEIIMAVLSAVTHIHDAKILHRDIKPENILILSSGGVKFIDFGIARMLLEPSITTNGEVLGTPSYMSPEQASGGDIDARSDIFSIGTIFFELVTGIHPFRGQDVLSTIDRIKTHVPDFDEVPKNLRRVISKSLVKDPGNRFQTAGEMLKAISFQSQPAVVAPQIPVIQAVPNNRIGRPYQIMMPQPGGAHGAVQVRPWRFWVRTTLAGLVLLLLLGQAWLPLVFLGLCGALYLYFCGGSRRKYSVPLAIVSVVITVSLAEVVDQMGWRLSPKSKAGISNTSSKSLPPRETVAVPHQELISPSTSTSIKQNMKDIARPSTLSTNATKTHAKSKSISKRDSSFGERPSLHGNSRLSEDDPSSKTQNRDEGDLRPHRRLGEDN